MPRASELSTTTTHHVLLVKIHQRSKKRDDATKHVEEGGDSVDSKIRVLENDWLTLEISKAKARRCQITYMRTDWIFGAATPPNAEFTSEQKDARCFYIAPILRFQHKLPAVPGWEYDIHHDQAIFEVGFDYLISNEISLESRSEISIFGHHDDIILRR